MAKESPLADPALAEHFATCLHEGYTIADLVKEFGVSRQTVGTWKKDPRIKVHMDKFGMSRRDRIAETVDAELERRLETSAGRKELTTRELIDIRVRLHSKDSDASQEVEVSDQRIFDFIEENPDLIVELRKRILNQ